MPDAGKLAVDGAITPVDSSPGLSSPEKTPEPQETEKPAKEPVSTKEEEPASTNEEEAEGETTKTMTSARISISSVKERMASLTEAVMVSTTAVPAQVQPPESKGRVSIPDAFQPKELSPPLSDRDSRSPSIERARRISGDLEKSEIKEPVFEDAPQKIEPAQAQVQESKREPPPPPPPSAPLHESEINVEKKEEQQPEVPQEQDPIPAGNSGSLDIPETKANVEAGSEQLAANHIADSASPNGDVNEN